MGSLFQVLDVARDGLTAQQAALNITGQNVANASTPGYVRRVAHLATTATNQPFGSVTLASVGRSVDTIADARVTLEGGLQGAALARSSVLADAESMLSPSEAPSIADRMSSFFGAMNSLGSNPVDPTARLSALASAKELAQGVAGAAEQLAGAREALLSKAQGVAGEINQRLAQIAELNGRIVTAQGLGSTPADLLDQRDILVREVGERMGAQALMQPSGAITLLSSGTALVEGTQAASIAVSRDAGGALAISVLQHGSKGDNITAGVTTGTLGGIREARDVDLVKTAMALDQLAYDLTEAVNAVHTAGYGLDGQTGRPLFVSPGSVAGAARAMAVDAQVLGNSKAIATASSPAGLPGGNDVAIALSQLSEKALGGAASPGQAFASVAAGLGSAKQAAESELTLRGATLAQANNLRDSVSGVSLDEEMVNLTKYQRAFQASVQVMNTINGLFDELMRL